MFAAQRRVRLTGAIVGSERPGPVPMRDLEVWVDGSKVAEQIDGFSYYTWLDQSVNLSPGAHSVTAYAAGWDQSLVKTTFVIHLQ